MEQRRLSVRRERCAGRSRKRVRNRPDTATGFLRFIQRKTERRNDESLDKNNKEIQSRRRYFFGTRQARDYRTKYYTRGNNGSADSAERSVDDLEKGKLESFDRQRGNASERNMESEE